MFLLHLHRLLFAHTAMPRGAFKAEDNLVVDRSPDGSATVRFKPVPAASTPFAVDDLIERYQHAVAAGEHHPVLLSGLLILDLHVIHPFEAHVVFADRAAATTTPGTKQQRIREHILRRAPATFRLADIRAAVPGVSDQTIRIVLDQLKSKGKARADGTGRAATWTRMTNTAPRG